MERTDISRRLISEEYIQENLIRIFPDSIILKGHCRVVAVSDKVAKTLGYDKCDLVDAHLQKISDHEALPKTIEAELSKGFFEGLLVTLKGKNQGAIACKLSGFYLGLISDINGTVVLRVEVLDEVKVLTNQLDASRNELDEFVYRTTHDLRGPLATIRGLINLIKIEKNVLTEDVKNLVNLMEVQAETLDGRLSSLNYVSETGYFKVVEKDLDCAELESTLRASLEQNMVINDTDFQLSTSQRFFSGIPAPLATAILNQLLLYLIHLPKGNDSKVAYTISAENHGMFVTIRADGFVSNYLIRQVIQQQNPLYTTVIMYSELINFFAAMRNAQRIRAVINVDFIDETNQQISVWIPGDQTSASYLPKAASY